MKKYFCILVLLLASCAAPAQEPQPEQRVPLASPTSEVFFLREFTTLSAPGVVIETREPNESVVLLNDTWVATAGGTVAGSHFARLKVKVPELYGIAPTRFYLRVTVILPADFYSKQRSGLRVAGVGNSPAKLNGVDIGGAGSGSGLFTSFYFHKDTGELRVASQYGSFPPVYYASLGRLPVGEHVLELFGDVANDAPWYARINGVTVASGTARLSPATVPVAERVVTRFVFGIDGAADQDANPISLAIRNMTIADHNPYPASATPSVTRTPSRTVTPTAMVTVGPSATFSATPSRTPSRTPTPVPTRTPTLTPTPTAVCFEVKDFVNFWICNRDPRK